MNNGRLHIWDVKEGTNEGKIIRIDRREKEELITWTAPVIGKVSVYLDCTCKRMKILVNWLVICEVKNGKDIMKEGMTDYLESTCVKMKQWTGL